MKNPNHFGTVTMLKGNRRRPFIVKEGRSGLQKIIGYAASREEGMILLSKYNNMPWDLDNGKMTLKTLYNCWAEKKTGRMNAGTLRAFNSAYNQHLSCLAGKEYTKIKYLDMQDTIDNCGRGASTQGLIKSLWAHLDKFALELDMPVRKYSEILSTDPVHPSTQKRMLSDSAVQTIWENQSLPLADTALFLLYSGFRASELCNIRLADINTDDWYITGGIKTEAGKNRIVPIHSKILDIVKTHMETSKSGYLFELKGKPLTYGQFKYQWKSLMNKLNLSYNPHECRHTFRSWLDSAGANQVCIDRLMGHASQGTGRRVYTHKTIEELKLNIELITR